MEGEGGSNLLHVVWIGKGRGRKREMCGCKERGEREREKGEGRRWCKVFSRKVPGGSRVDLQRVSRLTFSNLSFVTVLCEHSFQ